MFRKTVVYNRRSTISLHIPTVTDATYVIISHRSLDDGGANNVKAQHTIVH